MSSGFPSREVHFESRCVGILIIALPVGIVGSKFQEAYEDMEDSQFAELVASFQTDKDGGD